MDTSAHAYSRQVPLDRRLRASDADREAVGELLRKAHAAGRIDTDEFAERFGRCLQAKTYAELDQLISDLPSNDEGSLSQHWQAPAWPAAPGAGPSGCAPSGPGWWRPAPRTPLALWPLAAFVLMWVAIAFAVLAATGGHMFWFFLPLAWVFWFGRPGRRRWRCGRRDRPAGRTWEP